MLDKKQKKIVILEENHTRLDYLKSIVSQTSDLAFCFGQVANCFDNLFHLNPDLIVVGSLPREDIIRFINAHSATQCDFPSILITKDSFVKRYLKLNNDRGMFACDSELSLAQYKKSAPKIHKNHSHLSAGEDSPILVGSSPWVSGIKAVLPGLIRSHENVLIQGEKGTGKEYLARIIHLGDEHHESDIFAKMSASLLDGCVSNISLIDNLQNICGSMDQGGRGKGKRRVSVTLYIDELCDIPMFLQRDILMLMEYGNLNHGKKENVDIENLRLLVGTKVETEKYVSSQALRKDIFYRLNVLKIDLPPLRHRKEDIPFIIDFFVYRYCKRYGKSYFEMPGKAKQAFLQYDWPGNIRELEEVVKRMVLRGENEAFLGNMLPQETPIHTEQSEMWVESLRFIDEFINVKEYLNSTGNMPMKQICAEFMAEVEKKLMKSALVSTNWNRKKAASMLNISYKSILNKIKLYGLVS